MKKTLMFAFLLILIPILVLAAGENQFRIEKPTEYWVSVGGQGRVLKVFEDEKCNMLLRFFREDRNHLEELGEEEFDKDGVKTKDTYIENNGGWQKGYENRFRSRWCK